MKKTITKVLLSPINALVWIGNNPAETMLLSIFGFSFLPFFIHVGSPAMYGGTIGFLACIGEKYIFKYEKTTRLFNILILIILAIGIIGILTDGLEIYNSIVPLQKYRATYLGAFWGIMLSYLIVSINDQHREENRKQEEIDRKIMERQKQERQILQKEKEGLVAIKRNGKLIGYIDKDKYDDFVNKNVN